MEKEGSLLRLATRGDKGAVLAMLEAGQVDINEEADEDGSTPLLVAAQAGHASIVKILCEHGADVDKTADDNASPLIVAAMKGHLEVVETLCRVGAAKDKQRADGATPLFLAAQRGCGEVVQFLCAEGANKDKGRKHGDTPLLIAVENSQVEVVRVLLEARADTQLATTTGVTPLSAANSTSAFPEIEQMLIEAGATTEASNQSHNCIVFTVILFSVGCCAFWAYVIHLAHTIGWWDEPIGHGHDGVGGLEL